MKRRLLIAALFFLLFLTGCNDASYDAVVYLGESSLITDNVSIDAEGKKLAGYEWKNGDLILHFIEQK